MNKAELIEHIAKQADISKAAATRALEATIGAVRTTLKKGGSVFRASANGIAQRGKTKGTQIKMCGGGMAKKK